MMYDWIKIRLYRSLGLKFTSYPAVYIEKISSTITNCNIKVMYK